MKSINRKSNRKHDLSKAQLLPLSFKPNDVDILCGRGKVCSNRRGNKYYTTVTQNYIQDYIRATTRLQKSIVVSNVLKEVTKSGGRFIKVDKSTKRWYQMTPEQAHDKTGHSIRDFIRQQEKENAKRMSIKAITNTLQS
jgi:hypothetical protein